MIRIHSGPAPDPMPTTHPGLVDVVVKTIHEAMAFGVVPIWTVYERPKDQPEFFVARLHVSDAHGSQPTTSAFKGETLDSIRNVFTAAGLSFIPRDDADDPVIVECWL